MSELFDFDIWVGPVGDRDPVAWKKVDDFDPDDEELEETPKDVVAMLGFDPKIEWAED